MNRKKIARLTKKSLRQAIMTYFEENQKSVFNYKQLSAAMGITRQSIRLMVDEVLHELQQSHYLEEESFGKYRLAEAFCKPPKRENMGADVLSEFKLPEFYPQEAEEAAKALSEKMDAKEWSFREDFRKITTFTIDPQTAKDFDDALSYRRISDEKVEIGVHIADVTFYVKPGSVIDKEAQKRATSVYLVDKVIPMLPENLCNQLCSLRPDEDKRCFSCIFEMNNKAEILKTRITRSVIRSNRRLSYEEAQEILDGREDSLQNELRDISRLAQILRQNRFKNGAINFENSEVQFHLNEKGEPIGIQFRTSSPSHELIEEFMLLANQHVAEFVGKGHTRSFVYRIHDVPDPEKLANVSKFIKRFGKNLSTEGSKKDIAHSINKLLKDIHGEKEENLISTITIRAMAKAVYSTDNIGHYGLAFSHYTHFTSPIRRYPDMMVHRMLTHYLSGGKSLNKAPYEDLCKHCSDMEQIAAQAERASIKAMQVEFMSSRLGEIYDGIISGVTEFGLFVEIEENKCEGLLSMRDLDDDHYELDEQNYCLRGRRKRKIYRLGDSIRIQVARTNSDKRQLDFVLAPGTPKNKASASTEAASLSKKDTNNSL